MFHIALQFILFDKPKSIGALLGVVISLFLIGQQSGTFLFLTNAMSSLVDNTATDLWVVDDRTTNINALGRFDVRLLRDQPGTVLLVGGFGVGTVTMPGLGLLVGGSAINPVPRRNIEDNVRAVAADLLLEAGIEVTISVPQGLEMAKKTLNAR